MPRCIDNIHIFTFPAAEDTKTDASSSKESPIPAELSAVVEALKTVIKEEKSVSSELSHTTDKQMVQVRADTEALQQMVTGLCSTLQNNRYYIMYANIYYCNSFISTEQLLAGFQIFHLDYVD